jgi:hypothetical protein
MRDALPVSLVQQVRQLVLSQFSAGWGRVAGPDIDAALMLHGRQPGILLSGFAPVTQHAHMQQLINAVKPIMHDIYGEPAVALPQAWVRIMGAGELTDEHADYFMFQGIDCSCCCRLLSHHIQYYIYVISEQAFRMLTCWIPLGDYIPDVEGILSICAGSHDLLPANPTETVENVDELPVAFVQARHTVQSTGSETNRTHISTTSRSVVGPDEHWHVARSGVRMGDIVVFDIRAVHASSRNLSVRALILLLSMLMI